MSDVCSGCGQPVKTVITEGGKVRDLNPEPNPNGNHTMITVDGRVRAHVATGEELPLTETAYKVHQCPPKPAPGTPCTVCGHPMNRELNDREPNTMHPCCEPQYKRDAGELAAGPARPRRKARR
jgi:hypothetical protein